MHSLGSRRTTIPSSARALAMIAAGCVLLGTGERFGRAGEMPGRYEIANGTTRDVHTKLTWQQAVSLSSYAWLDAGAYCASLNLNGGGWRLPSVAELQTIVDERRSSPAIDPTAFPATPVDFFWTSSSLAGFTSFVWAIHFDLGIASFSDASQLHRVRCVR
jgi:Protein of unknown function (DUF1566)